MSRDVWSLSFALWPDEATRARLAETASELRRRYSPPGRWVRPPRFQMPLHFLCEGPHPLPA